MEIQTFFLVTFIIWSLPSNIARSRFRKMVYKTDNWIINIQPYFTQEIKVLFGIHKITDKNDIKLINFYRFYLTIYIILFIGVIYF